MDCSKVGKAIRQLRKEKNYTQVSLATKMNISEKTVSKWERGLGCPDVACLNQLAEILQTSVESILKGEVTTKIANSGNIKNLKFYICPKCKNVTFSFDNIMVSCCNRKIQPTPIQMATNENMLNVKLVENEWRITSNQNMTKDNYIMMIAYILYDSISIKRFYAESDLYTSFYNYGRGKVVWATSNGEVFCLKMKLV